MKNFVGIKKRMVAIVLLVAIATLGTAQAALASTVHYRFYRNVPNYGWVYSSNKSLLAGVSFRTRLDSCIANNGSSQGSLGVLMKPMNASNNTPIGTYTKVLPGQYKTLISATTSNRTVYIGLQAVGTQYVTADGYWYY